MARYMVLWKANSSSWPVDPKQVAEILEGVSGGADMLLAGGALTDLGWFTAEEGYGIFEAESKEAVLGLVQPFFPLFSNDIREIVPWEAGKQAVLASARQMASR